MRFPLRVQWQGFFNPQKDFDRKVKKIWKFVDIDMEKINNTNPFAVKISVLTRMNDEWPRMSLLDRSLLFNTAIARGR